MNSLLENVREILENHAVSRKFSKVTKVTLEIGKLSSVEPDAFIFFSSLLVNTGAASGYLFKA